MPSPDHSTLLPVHEPDSPRLGGKFQPGSGSQAAALPPGPLPACSQDIAFTSAAQSMDITSHQQQYQQQYQYQQQQQQQQQQFLVGQGSAGSGSRPQAPLSFAQPDDWLMQQLSNKLVPIDSKMLTVSSDDSKGSGYGKRGSARRGSQSADPSPRWERVRVRVRARGGSAYHLCGARRGQVVVSTRCCCNLGMV